MCHAIGQMHEQSRSDRDKYIDMHWNNIRGGTGNNNMHKENTRDNNPYDAESVLQYSLYVNHCQNPPNCQNGGFLNFQCVCVCPDGLTGSTCEQIADACGGIITLTPGQTEEIKSPNYPSPYPQGTKCTWLLK
ncbi:hypothetical protein KUTeg_002389, partial [Tegillarca granosa]